MLDHVEKAADCCVVFVILSTSSSTVSIFEQRLLYGDLQPPFQCQFFIIFCFCICHLES